MLLLEKHFFLWCVKISYTAVCFYLYVSKESQIRLHVLMFLFLTISLAFRTNSTVLGCAGFHGDCLTLTKVIKARLQVCTQQLFCRWFQYHPWPKMDKLTRYKLCTHVCTFAPAILNHVFFSQMYEHEHGSKMRYCCPLYLLFIR